MDRLAIAMLRDILGTLETVRALAPIAVVTPDPAVAKIAADAGVVGHLCPLELNPALESAASQLTSSDDAALVVLGDIAGARADDLEELVAALPDRGVALAPSRDGGTSALLRRPRDVIAASFGPDSARRHRELATRAGLPYREIELESLAIDIDEPADLEAFARGPSAGEHTRALLRELLPELAP